MDSFKLYTETDIASFTNQREGEKKLGQTVQTISHLDLLASTTATFVVLGIPEDIGIRANHGIGGSATTWKPALMALLNFQANTFLRGEEILILGHFEIEEPKDLSLLGLRRKTAQIDALVAPVIEAIVAAGKIPIVIGGGHNNALPIIIGAAKAFKTAIPVINIDAHADLRNTAEGRHSGNPFSNALEMGYLSNYRVFGVHQSYVNDQLMTLLNSEKVGAVFFDDLLKSDLSIAESFEKFTADEKGLPGLEIDLDSIENTLSSAVSPTGFSINDVRKIILRSKKMYCYLHICEGAFELNNGRMQETIGKVVAYLVTDFIKALRPHIYPQP